MGKKNHWRVLRRHNTILFAFERNNLAALRRVAWAGMRTKTVLSIRRFISKEIMGSHSREDEKVN